MPSAKPDLVKLLVEGVIDGLTVTGAFPFKALFKTSLDVEGGVTQFKIITLPLSVLFTAFNVGMEGGVVSIVSGEETPAFEVFAKESMAKRENV